MFQSNVVTERIITPEGNLTKTIITIPDTTSTPAMQSPQWNLVNIDIDTGDTVNDDNDDELMEDADVGVHYVKMLVDDGDDHGLLLETDVDDGGVYVEDIVPGGRADQAAYPGFQPG